jgi:hypothetical protein
MHQQSTTGAARPFPSLAERLAEFERQRDLWRELNPNAAEAEFAQVVAKLEYRLGINT